MSISIFNRESKIIDNITRIFNWTLQILKNNKNRHCHLNLYLLTVKIHVVALFSYINIVVLMYGVHCNYLEYLKMWKWKNKLQVHVSFCYCNDTLLVTIKSIWHLKNGPMEVVLGDWLKLWFAHQPLLQTSYNSVTLIFFLEIQPLVKGHLYSTNLSIEAMAPIPHQAWRSHTIQ